MIRARCSTSLLQSARICLVAVPTASALLQHTAPHLPSPLLHPLLSLLSLPVLRKLRVRPCYPRSKRACSFFSCLTSSHGVLLAIRVEKPFAYTTKFSSTDQEQLSCPSKASRLQSAISISHRHVRRSASIRSGQSLRPYRLSEGVEELERLYLLCSRLHAQRDGQHLVSSPRLGFRSLGTRGGRARSSVEAGG